MTGQKAATRLRYNSAQQKTQKVSFVNFFSTVGYPSTSTRDWCLTLDAVYKTLSQRMKKGSRSELGSGESIDN